MMGKGRVSCGHWVSLWASGCISLAVYGLLRGTGVGNQGCVRDPAGCLARSTIQPE